MKSVNFTYVCYVVHNQLFEKGENCDETCNLQTCNLEWPLVFKFVDVLARSSLRSEMVNFHIYLITRVVCISRESDKM